MTETIIPIIVEYALEAIGAIIAVLFTTIAIPWLKKTGIPWLQEKRLFSLADKFVHAAEKLASSGGIPKATKKAYVVGQFEKKGIAVTPEIDAYIEAAVEKLDIALDGGIQLIGEAFENATTEGEDEAEDPDPK